MEHEEFNSFNNKIETTRIVDVVHETYNETNPNQDEPTLQSESISALNVNELTKKNDSVVKSKQQDEITNLRVLLKPKERMHSEELLARITAAQQLIKSDLAFIRKQQKLSNERNKLLEKKKYSEFCEKAGELAGKLFYQKVPIEELEILLSTLHERSEQ